MKRATILKKPAGQIALVGGYLFLLFALVIAGNVVSQERYTTFVTVLLSIFLEATPFLLVGSLVSGLIHVFVDQQLLSRVVPRHPLWGAFLGAASGIVFPVCECGVIPVTRRLYQKGLPLSTGIAFILAAPVINPIVIASTYAAFGWGPMLFGRLGLSFLIAGATGLLFSLAAPEEILLHEARKTRGNFPENPPVNENETAHLDISPLEQISDFPLKERIYEAFASAGDDFLDMIRYLIVGAVVAAGLQTLIPQSTLMALNTNAVLSVISMMLLAFLLSVCSTADAFLALAFMNSFMQASVLAFLVFGPMVDIKSTLMLLRIFRRRSILYLILLAGMMTLTATVFLNLQVRW